MSKQIKQMEMDALKSTFQGVRDMVFMSISGVEFVGQQAAAAEQVEEGGKIEGRSQWQLTWRRLRQDKVAVGALVVIVVMIVLAIAAPARPGWRAAARTNSAAWGRLQPTPKSTRARTVNPNDSLN